MAVKITTKAELKTCPDCESEHLGGPCGMTQRERFKTVKMGTEWMPSKQADRTTTYVDDTGVRRPEKEYYDDNQLTELFGDGLTGKERKEQLMEETKGVGFATKEDIEKHPDLVYEHFLNDPNDVMEAPVAAD